MKEDIMNTLAEYHKNQGIVFMSEEEAIDYYKGLVELLEQFIKQKI